MEMTDAASALRSAYYSLLSGQLTANSKPVPVDSFKSSTDKDVVVVLGNIAETESPWNKEQYGKEVTFNVEVQHYVLGTGKVSSTLVDAVASQIQKLLKTGTAQAPSVSGGADWKVLSTRLISSMQLNGNTATGQLVRKIMVFQHTLKQIG